MSAVVHRSPGQGSRLWFFAVGTAQMRCPGLPAGDRCQIKHLRVAPLSLWLVCNTACRVCCCDARTSPLTIEPRSGNVLPRPPSALRTTVQVLGFGVFSWCSEQRPARCQQIVRGLSRLQRHRQQPSVWRACYSPSLILGLYSPRDDVWSTPDLADTSSLTGR